jgi:OPA family glycerol-3-phosphate transporter-like MFS transporter
MSAIAIAYGLSKFLMGLVSDRSNPRYFRRSACWCRLG